MLMMRPGVEVLTAGSVNTASAREVTADEKVISPCTPMARTARGLGASH